MNDRPPMSPEERDKLALLVASAEVKLNPEDPEAYAGRAGVLWNMGRLDEARADLDTADRLGATSHTFYFHRAVVLAETGDLTEAKDAFELALSLAPDRADYHQHYGTFLLSIGDKRGWEEYEWRMENPEYLAEHGLPRRRG